MKMNKEVLTTAMKNSISDVLETMFFLPVDFDDSVSLDEVLDPDKDKIIAAKLNFDGPLSGYCIFYVPEKLAVSITADFLGKENEDISDHQVKETVKEMTNMITGNTFSLYASEAVFNLGLPELVSLDGFHRDSSGSENKISITIDTLENRLAFQLNIKNA
ncbi:MAG: chemotaxis protein CheX [Deltaproteobacteria bacterium]|nr:chemotaxis protein CheX [Deltaproteobacteria bacterium]